VKRRIIEIAIGVQVEFCDQTETGTFDRTQIAKCRFRLITKLLTPKLQVSGIALFV
jgi:hypothetical protein